MDNYGFHDGNIYNLLEGRYLDVRPDVDRSLQMHSSWIRRLSQERELEGHKGCVNSIAWNSKGSLLISGSDDIRVEVGNPNVVWSASEDGTLRQHDFREGASCPPGGSYPHECRNILSGAKRSVADPPKQTLALKSCNISTSRPHLLLVGGSDAFARLFDRRMLPPLTSHRKRMNPPPCANYFCPMHLSEHLGGLLFDILWEMLQN